jgi:hypothetical protein
MVRVTCVRNYFDPLKDRETLMVDGPAKVMDLVHRLYPTIQESGYEIVASVNGKLLNDFSNNIVKDEDYLIFCVVPQGGGGKNILRIIAMLAVMVAATVYGGPGGAAIAGELGITGASGIAAVKAIFTAGLVMAGGMIVNTVLPPAMRDTTPGGGDLNYSPTYGWQIDANPDIEGVASPVLYGTHRVVPPRIGKYIQSDGDKQYYNILFELADHTINPITPLTDIRINGDVAELYEGVGVWLNQGTTDLWPIQYFTDTKIDTAVGAKLSTAWTTRTTSGNTVEGILIGLICPKGLYYAADDGSLQSVTVEVDIEYSPDGITWTRFQTYNSTDVTITETRWSGGYYHPNWVDVWVELEAGSTTYADHTEGEPYEPDEEEWFYIPPAGVEDYGYNVRPTYIWRWMTAQTVKGPGSIAYDYIRITGAQSTPLRRIAQRDRLPAGEYQIRARLRDVYEDGPRYGTDVYWEYFQEVVYDDFSYPGTALLSISILATDQLSGGIPKVDVLISRDYVSVYVPSTQSYVDKLSNNPAWACYDMLHNSIYGAAIPHERINYDAFSEWASYCDSEGFTVNIYFDSFVSLRQALNVISINGRASVVQLGSKWTVIMDKPGSTPVQGFLFGMGNIEKDSYTEEWIPMEDRADAIEITYFDADLDYSRQALELHTSDYDTTTREVKKSSITLYGCTNRSIAIRHGKYLLNCTRLITLKNTWSADVDALACITGDIVEISHDIPQFGYSGRIVSATSNTVTLDRDVTLYPSTNYVIVVRHQDDDEREEQAIEVVLSEITTNVLTLTSTWTTVPTQHTNYSFGELNEATKLMRIVRISKDGQVRVKIEAVEYLDEVFVDTATVPAITSPSDLALTTGLQANEVYKGGSTTCVALTWRGVAILWNIWIRRGANGNWVFLGETRSPYYEIQGLDYGIEYYFAVSHTTSPDDGEIDNLTLTGKTSLPGDVGVVTGFGLEDGALFEWSEVTDFDLKGYHVRHGIHWSMLTAYEVGDIVVPTEGDEERYICITAGVSGATEPTWSTTGVIDDGESYAAVEWEYYYPSYGWEPDFVNATSFKKGLTASEMQIQSTGALVVRIWVRAVDAFGNESEIAATSTAQCLNQKAYVVTIGPEPFDGKYGDINFALSRMSNGGTLILKNGIYQMTDEIAVPDVNLDIIGETKEGVIIKNLAGSDLFTWYEPTKIFSFRNFTIESQNTSVFSRMFYSSGFTPGANSGEYTFDNLNLQLEGDQEYNDDQDRGFDMNNGADNLTIRRCCITGGSHGAYIISWWGLVTILENVFTNQTFCGFSLGSLVSPRNLKVIDNRVLGAWGYGLTVLSYSADEADIESNLVEMNDNATSAMVYAFYLRLNRANIFNNKIKTIQVGSSGYPIRLEYLRNCNVSGNYFEVIQESTAAISGLYLNNVEDSRITGNGILVDDGDTTAAHVGMAFVGNSVRNTVNGNHVDMVNNVVGKDYGYLFAAAGDTDNTGEGNISYRAGNDLSDSGAANTVTVKGV